MFITTCRRSEGLQIANSRRRTQKKGTEPSRGMCFIARLGHPAMIAD